MAITNTQITTAFKIFGKFIFLSNLAEAQSTEFQALSMAIDRQAVSGVAAEFANYYNVITPLLNSVYPMVNGLNGLQSVVTTAVTSYLLQTLAPMLGVTTGNPTDVWAALTTTMTTLGMYVTDGGQFATFFTGNGLPTSGATLIPESYVTDQVI